MLGLIVDCLANGEDLRVVDHSHRRRHRWVVSNANAVGRSADFLVTTDPLAPHEPNARNVLDVSKVSPKQMPINDWLPPRICRRGGLFNDNLSFELADVHNEYSV